MADEEQSYTEYATTDRHMAIAALMDDGASSRVIAEKMESDPANIRKVMRIIRARAAKKGHAPEHDMTHPVAEGFAVKGQSSLYRRGEPEPVLQWVKTNQDAEKQVEILRALVENMASAVPPQKPVPAPKVNTADLMSVYPMFDAHLGMYAWAAECGEDFDLKIAEQDILAAVDYLVDQSPASERGLLINGGDFFHAENMDGVTSRSGHVLDMDTRFHMMIDVGISVMRRCIHRMLEKHQTVEVVTIPGNHDETMQHALGIFLRCMYENEPRVIIHCQPTERRYIQHGKVLMGIVHGHKTKDAALPGIMATEQAPLWGKTVHRYFFRGHHHHDSRVEYPGCIVEQFRQLSASDAFAVGGGYLSGRDMKCIVMHKETGEYVRFTCGIDVVRLLRAA